MLISILLTAAISPSIEFPTNQTHQGGPAFEMRGLHTDMTLQDAKRAGYGCGFLNEFVCYLGPTWLNKIGEMPVVFSRATFTFGKMRFLELEIRPPSSMPREVQHDMLANRLTEHWGQPCATRTDSDSTYKWCFNDGAMTQSDGRAGIIKLSFTYSDQEQRAKARERLKAIEDANW